PWNRWPPNSRIASARVRPSSSVNVTSTRHVGSACMGTSSRRATIIRPVIRPATTADALAIAAIYNQGIAERQATFETEPRCPGDLQSDLLLVAERDGRVVGWAAVAAYSDRCVYAGVGEYTIYVDRGARGT